MLVDDCRADGDPDQLVKVGGSLERVGERFLIKVRERLRVAEL